jgi:DNA polymerase elongation subunit (family B)
MEPEHATQRQGYVYFSYSLSSPLVITNPSSKADYTNKQPHVELTERNLGSTPALGDRAAYVIVKGNKNAPYL